MKFRFSNWTPSLVLASALAASVSGCGDDGASTPAPGDNDSGIGADTGVGPAATTGKPTASPTGKPSPSSTTKPQASGSGKPGPAGDAGDTGDTGVPTTPGDDGSVPPAGDGGVVIPPASGDLDDLIGAICEWEFRCCDDGERAYRFGPTVADAAACKTRFVEELREKNSSTNPFVSGSAAGGLLASLAYTINLDRVTVNKDAVAACTEQVQALDCAKPAPDVAPRCTAAGTASVNPCALDQLFAPKLAQGNVCAPALGQGYQSNDIECESGTSCLAATDPDNPTGGAACISRGVLDDACTTDVDCDFGYYCNDATSCQPKGEEGDNCTYEDDVDAPGTHPSSCNTGLSCDPKNGKCVAACSDGYECAVDSQCPSGSSCAPVYDGDELFHVCRKLGTGAAAKCDSELDCVEAQYCDLTATPGSCAADKDINEDCTNTPGQCADGTYCDGATCQAYKGPTDVCSRTVDSTLLATDFPECAPTSAGCLPRFDAELIATEFKCRTAKNPNGEDCVLNDDCVSGKCEVIADVVDGHLTMTCTAGANVGADCDSDAGDKEALSCKPGSFCNTDGKCEAQGDPGADCELEDGDAADALLCASGSCAKQWNTYICTDAPVPKNAGGTGLTCDGNE